MAYRNQRPSERLWYTHSFTGNQGYTYSNKAAQTLVAWYRFDKDAPRDLGPNKIVAQYEGAPAVSQVKFGDSYYPAATFSDSNNYNAKVIDLPIGRFSFVDPLGTDRPFSISLWAKTTSMGALNYLFSKSSGGNKNEYFLYVTSNGSVPVSYTHLTLPTTPYV